MLGFNALSKSNLQPGFDEGEHEHTIILMSREEAGWLDEEE